MTQWAGDTKKEAYTRHRREFWNLHAASLENPAGFRTAYQRRLSEIYRHMIPRDARVLELGCGTGDLLGSLCPSRGVGIDFSGEMVSRARTRHPHLVFLNADVHSFELEEKFDYIICSDLLCDLWDVQQVFVQLQGQTHASTRIIINLQSRLWELPLNIFGVSGIMNPSPQNWLTVEDVSNLLYLSGYQVLRSFSEILWPAHTPGIEKLLNHFLVKLWPLRLFALSNFLIARPEPAPQVAPEPVVSVIVPLRNEEGNIPQIFERTPELGAGTELILVEGGSSDDTWSAVERELAVPGCRRAKLLKQQGEGKGDAVRIGFSHAAGQLLMILDGDLTVSPEELSRFYEAYRSRKADFVNGVRLVYPMECQAMRFFNLIGNKFFSLVFSWLLGQDIKDCLCGTKVLSASAYRMIAADRSLQGKEDPFGDFELLFGAAKYNLKIVDLPVRYGRRTYGVTNIRRWHHGWMLLRMAIRAVFTMKFV